MEFDRLNAGESKASEDLEKNDDVFPSLNPLEKLYLEWESNTDDTNDLDAWTQFAEEEQGATEQEAMNAMNSEKIPIWLDRDPDPRWVYDSYESKASEVSAEEEEVANDLWQALGEGGLKSDYINGGIFKFDITYPSWVSDPEMDVSDIMWDELTATDKQNVVNHFGGVEGMKEKLCDEGWDNYCEEDDDDY